MDNRHKEPRTIREQLGAALGVRPAISGGGSVSTYVAAQANPIGRDATAGEGMGRLAAALRPWDRSLDDVMTRITDRQIEEDTKAAELFKMENPEMTKNMEVFRQAALSDPKILELSPHVKKAIEAEILQSSAIHFAADMQDAYTTSGMRNERDASKVMAWGEEYRKQYMEKQGYTSYEDRLFLAQHFAHPSKKALEGLLIKHNNEVESQNSAMLEQQKAQNIQDALAMRRNLTTAAGKYDTKIPAERAGYAQEAAQVILAEAEDMKRLGYSQARIMTFLGNMVLQGNHSASTARQIAQSITVDVGGKPVSLMSQPGVAKGIEQLEEQETSKAWAAESRAHTRRQWQREDAARTATAKGYEYGATGNPDLSRGTIVDKLKLCSPEDYPHFKQAAEDGQRGQFMSMYANPTLASAALALESDLKQGKAGKAEVMELARQGYNPAQVQRLLALADGNATAEGQALLSAQANIAKTYISMIGNVSNEEANELYHSYQNGTSTKPAAGILAQVMMDLPEVNTAFADFVAEKKKEKAEKAGTGEAKDAPLSSLDMQRIAQDFQGQYLDKRIKATKDRYTIEKSQLTDNRQTRSYLTDTKAVEKIGAGSSSFFSRPNPGQAEVFTGAVTNVNTLFADSLASDPAAMQQLGSMKTLQEVLSFVDSRVEGGLTWQEMYFLVRGHSPESKGITDAKNAQTDLYNWFKEKGIKASPPPTASGKAGATKFSRQIEVK